MKNNLIFPLGFALLSTPLAGAAAQFGDFTYETNDNAITITGYTGAGGSVTIPSAINGLPVSIIGTNAFCCGGMNITGITVPDSVINIEDTAFLTCAMSAITIPNSVINLGYGVFFGCSNLTSITIPNRVTTLRNGVCYGCSSLTNITIPNNVTNLGNGAFYGCSSLASITMPQSVTSLGNGVFAECSRLTSVFFEGKVPSVGSSVFSNDINATIYYLPGTTGWDSTFADRPTVLWTVGPIIRANLSRDDITISIGENLSILVQIIDSGQYAGTEVDWWIVALAGSDWYYLNSCMQWTAFDGNLLNCHPVYQGALFDLPIIEILNMTVIGGSYTFWFAINYPMDGVLDVSKPTLVDSVSVTVQ